MPFLRRSRLLYKDGFGIDRVCKLTLCAVLLTGCGVTTSPKGLSPSESVTPTAVINDTVAIAAPKSSNERFPYGFGCQSWAGVKLYLDETEFGVALADWLASSGLTLTDYALSARYLLESKGLESTVSYRLIDQENGEIVWRLMEPWPYRIQPNTCRDLALDHFAAVASALSEWDGTPVQEELVVVNEESQSATDPDVVDRIVGGWVVRCSPKSGCLASLPSLSGEFFWEFRIVRLQSRNIPLPEAAIISSDLYANDPAFNESFQQVHGSGVTGVMTLFGNQVHEPVADDERLPFDKRASVTMQRYGAEGRYIVKENGDVLGSYWSAYLAACEPKLAMWVPLGDRSYKILFDLQGADSVLAYLKSQQAEVPFDLESDVPIPCFSQ